MKLIFQLISVEFWNFNLFWLKNEHTTPFFKYIIHQDLHVFHKNSMEVIFVY